MVPDPGLAPDVARSGTAEVLRAYAAVLAADRVSRRDEASRLRDAGAQLKSWEGKPAVCGQWPQLSWSLPSLARWCGWSIGHRIATTCPRSVGSPSRSWCQWRAWSSTWRRSGNLAMRARAGRSLTPLPKRSRSSGRRRHGSGGCCNRNRFRCSGQGPPGRSLGRCRLRSSRSSSGRCRGCRRLCWDSSGTDGWRTCTPFTGAWDPADW